MSLIRWAALAHVIYKGLSLNVKCKLIKSIIFFLISGVEMKLINPDGHVVAKGEVGELCVRSVFRFLEYHGAQASFGDIVDRGNWLHTGDMCHVRADGNFVMKGRRSEAVSIGSVKIFPCDVEKLFGQCKGVAMFAAVGVPDSRLYEVVCVCVVPEHGSGLTKEDVQTFCDNTWTSNAFEKPKYVVLFEDFPSNSSGKLDRKALAAQAQQRLSL